MLTQEDEALEKSQRYLHAGKNWLKLLRTFRATTAYWDSLLITTLEVSTYIQTRDVMGDNPDDLPYRAEYAKSGRAKCKACKADIPKGDLRMAAMVQVKPSPPNSPFFYLPFFSLHFLMENKPTGSTGTVFSPEIGQRQLEKLPTSILSGESW